MLRNILPLCISVTTYLSAAETNLPGVCSEGCSRLSQSRDTWNRSLRFSFPQQHWFGRLRCLFPIPAAHISPCCQVMTSLLIFILFAWPQWFDHPFKILPQVEVGNDHWKLDRVGLTSWAHVTTESHYLQGLCVNTHWPGASAAGDCRPQSCCSPPVAPTEFLGKTSSWECLPAD